MGIGEPLLNLPALEHALDAVRDEIGLGARKITVSTVGFPDRLRRLAERKPRFQLAISLHTPFDEQRDELVPLMAGTSIEDILEAGDHWFQVTGREVTYEYVLLGGANDSYDHAERLVARLRGRRATVNGPRASPRTPLAVSCASARSAIAEGRDAGTSRGPRQSIATPPRPAFQ
jgi:23S rRNA (adenine2503-C2)-methyltransferase